ncbi:MAG: DUF2807 domain-containing protein [Flavobacteriaceae bacterium]|nr:DUF2807 domain-containing protein [Flavobacteriaceae bacterium]
MKTSNLIALGGVALLFMLSIAFQSRVHYHVKKERKAGFGARMTQDRPLDYFEGIRIEAPIHVVFTQDSIGSIAVSAPEEIIDSVTTQIVDRVLYLSLNGKKRGKDTILIKIHNPKLESLELTNGSFENSGTLQCTTFRLQMADKSHCRLRLDSPLLEVANEKGADLTLEGTTEQINFINQ